MQAPAENLASDKDRPVAPSGIGLPERGAGDVNNVTTGQSEKALGLPGEGAHLRIRASTFNNIYFAYGSSEFTESARKSIERHAERLLANPRKLVTLVGYTDDLSSSSYSIALGVRRAEAVREQLLLLKVLPSQVRIISYGHDKFPTVPCHSEVCRESYRRVELRYSRSDSAG